MELWLILMFVAGFIGWFAFYAWLFRRLQLRGMLRNPSNGPLIIAVTLVMACIVLGFASGRLGLSTDGFLAVLFTFMVETVCAAVFCDQLASVINRFLPFN